VTQVAYGELIETILEV